MARHTRIPPIIRALLTQPNLAVISSEFVGTLTIVAIAVASVFVAGGTTNPTSLQSVALAYGLAVAVMVTATGKISGGHLNPAITFALLVCRRTALRDALRHWAAQLAGGIAGALLIRLALPSQIRGTNLVATPTLAGYTSHLNGLLLESLMTFFLVWVFLAVVVDARPAWGILVGLPIGLTVTVDVLIGGPLTGAAMNPARVLGPSLVFGGVHRDQWVYWLGPLAGATVAALAYQRLVLPRTLSRASDSQ